MTGIGTTALVLALGLLTAASVHGGAFLLDKYRERRPTRAHRRRRTYQALNPEEYQ